MILSETQLLQLICLNPSAERANKNYTYLTHPYQRHWALFTVTLSNRSADQNHQTKWAHRRPGTMGRTNRGVAGRYDRNNEWHFISSCVFLSYRESCGSRCHSRCKGFIKQSILVKNSIYKRQCFSKYIQEVNTTQMVNRSGNYSNNIYIAVDSQEYLQTFRSHIVFSSQ